MEKLGDSWHLHMAYDWPVLRDHLRWTASTDVYGNFFSLKPLKFDCVPLSSRVFKIQLLSRLQFCLVKFLECMK